MPQQERRIVEILFFAGSSQVGSVHWQLPRAAAELAVGVFGGRATVTVIDLADYDLPAFAPERADAEPPPALAGLRAAVVRCRAAFIGSDEYTGTYSAVLKNALAWLGSDPDRGESPFRAKPVALCGASLGGVAGLRGQPALFQLLTELGADVLSQRLELGTASSPFDPAGRLRPKVALQLSEGLLRRLLAAAEASWPGDPVLHDV